MAWLEVHQELPSHPKTVKAGRLLDIRRTSVVGHMVSLWLWALDHAQDGDLSGYDADEIANAAGWDGEPQAFVDALLTCGRQGKAGFLEIVDEKLLIHDWLEYTGKLIERRRQDAERKRTGRRNEITGTSSGHPADIRRTSGGSLKPSSVTVQYSTIPLKGGIGGAEPDPEWAQAFQAFEVQIGKVSSGFTLQEMQETFDELRGAGRADWWELALKETHRLQGNSWTYMSKVIAGAVKNNMPPGSKPAGNGKKEYKPNGRSYTNGITAFGSGGQKYDDGIPDEWRGREAEYFEFICQEAPPPAA